MQNDFFGLAQDDVIYFTEDGIGSLPATSRVEQLVRKIQSIDPRHERNQIFSHDGLECEILRPDAQGWQKGIVRVSIEFMPVPDVIESETWPPENDEQSQFIAENPLDIIRQAALQNNS